MGRIDPVARIEKTLEEQLETQISHVSLWRNAVETHDKAQLREQNQRHTDDKIPMPGLVPEELHAQDGADASAKKCREK